MDIVNLAFDQRLSDIKKKHEILLNMKNEPVVPGNGIYVRYKYPVLTAEHAPLEWRYDLNPRDNPFLMERFGINATFNAGAIKWNGKYILMVRVEGNDRKSFFALAESPNGVDHFQFVGYPITLPETDVPDTNVYDMRLTKHEDGYIYGVFCSESKDTASSDLSAAVASAGIVRTKDLKKWERLPNLKTLRSPQQRNVVLHPEFVKGKYAFYTRPMDGFIETGSGGGIGFGLCDDMAAGLRYVLYAFATALEDPSRIIAEPGGMLMGPRGAERAGDVSNVVFTNGAITGEDGKIYLYYASSDTRLHVAVTTVERLSDYVFHTPKDPLRSSGCVSQRCELIDRNLEILKKEQEWKEV